MKGQQSMRNEAVRPARILVVEDERLVALDIQHALIDLGYVLAGTAARGEEAVLKARTSHPDLVLMDIHLQGAMDGIDAASAIQKEMDIPVIYLSAFSDADTLCRARSSAPFGYLIKPFKQAELVCAVEVALGRWLVEQRARERELTSRATEEISRPRLQELLCALPPHALPRSAEDPLAAVRRAAIFDPRAVELPSAPFLTTARTQTGNAILIESAPVGAEPGSSVAEARARHNHADLCRTQDMPVSEELAPLEAQPTVRTSLDEHDGPKQGIQGVDALTASLAHDFNDILSAILVNGHFLLDGMDADDPRCEEVEEICSAAERGAALTQRLLAFSRRQILQPSLVDLNGLVRTMDRSLRRFAGQAVDVALRLAPGLGQVKADRRQVEQAISNLVINAREAMPSGGRLVIETANVAVESLAAVGPVPVVPGNYVSLAVSDSGRGMDAATQERAFEPFFTTKDRGRGLGLGLSTVYTMVDQIGGHVCLNSEPGRGTTVTIYLPREQAAVSAEPTAVTELSLVGSESILLVDDDAGVRNAVGRILTARGYRVLMARSGDEAIELAARRDRPIDLLLTDLLVPDLTGPEIARKLSTIEPAPRVLFMSGYTDHAVLGDGSVPDSVQYLQKPFAPETLLRKVREVLDGARPPAIKAD